MTDTAKLSELLRMAEPNEAGCMIWKGGATSKNPERGYGYLRVQGKGVRAHRAVMQAVIGRELDRSELVCHHCDVPACVNPAHLYIGTPTTNAADMIARGRACYQRHPEISRRNGEALQEILAANPEKRPRGERHGHSRFTDAERAEIVASPDSSYVIARKFGVTPPAIQRLRRLARGGVKETPPEPEGFIAKRWMVTVPGYGSAPYTAMTRGRAFANAWRSDVFEGVSFAEFLKVARCRRDPITPPRWGDQITVNGKPAFFLGNNCQYVQLVYPGRDVVLNAHPYDVLPVEYRPDNYRDRDDLPGDPS